MGLNKPERLCRMDMDMNILHARAQREKEEGENYNSFGGH